MKLTFLPFIHFEHTKTLLNDTIILLVFIQELDKGNFSIEINSYHKNDES